MAGEIEHFGDKQSSNGFKQNPQNINRSGRGVSLKKKLAELLLKDGELPIPKISLKKETDTHYIFKLPTQDALSMKLISIAMSKGSNSLKAIQMILEHFDGKPRQEVDTHMNITSDMKKQIAAIFPTKEDLKNE